MYDSPSATKVTVLPLVILADTLTSKQGSSRTYLVLNAVPKIFEISQSEPLMTPDSHN
jgi:hypothetical protein